jgi:Uma2 family endonuclease
MMATSVMVPLEEYLTTSYEHDCEWIEGELKERGMPDEFHSAIQAFLMEYFAGLKEELGVRVRAELRVKVAPKRYRIPDVTLIPANAPFLPIPSVPPVLCVEVLSPDDRVGDLEDKIADYIAMGVGAIWIIDPRRRSMATADATGIHVVQEFALNGTQVRLSKAELFAELDELGARL